MVDTTSLSLPVFLRVGEGPEHEIGTVAAAAAEANVVGAVAQLLRAAADEVDPPAQPDPDPDATREQPSPRDRQVRGPRRDR